MADRLAPGLEPAPLAAWLTWAVERGLHQMVRGADDETARRHVEALTHLVWSAVYAAAVGAGRSTTRNAAASEWSPGRR